MNKILILLFLIFTINVKSQSNDKAKIDKAIVNKTIEYIGDCVQHTDLKKISVYQNIEKNKSNFYKDLNKFDSIIRNEFINTYNSFTSPLIELKKASKSKYVVFLGKLKDNSNEKFKKYFGSDIIKNINQEFENQIINNKNKIDELNNSIKILYLVIILLFILLIFFVFKKPKTIFVKEEKKQDSTIYYRNPYEEEVERYKEQIKTLNLKVDHLESKLSDLNIQKKNDVIIEIQEGDIPVTPNSTTVKQYYLLAPIADKTFNEEHKSSVSEYGNSMFLFTLSEKETHASFVFCGDNKVLSYVMDFPDESIERVCEYENSKSEYKSEIITTTPGEAELRGGNWIVTKPAKIKFQ